MQIRQTGVLEKFLYNRIAESDYFIVGYWDSYDQRAKYAPNTRWTTQGIWRSTLNLSEAYSNLINDNLIALSFEYNEELCVVARLLTAREIVNGC